VVRPLGSLDPWRMAQGRLKKLAALARGRASHAARAGELTRGITTALVGVD